MLASPVHRRGQQLPLAAILQLQPDRQLVSPMPSLPGGVPRHSGDVYEASDLAHSPSWRYFTSGLVLDTSSCSVGQLQLDLKAVAESAADWPTLTGFLMRRRALPPAAPLAAEPRKLLMQVCCRPRSAWGLPGLTGLEC